MQTMRGFILGFTLLVTLSSVRNQEDKGLIKCDQGSYKCADDSKCVSDQNLCDFKKDCDDLSDENFEICQTIHSKKSSCQPGQIYSIYGCQTISQTCTVTSGVYDQQFSTLCNDLQDRLNPFEEVAAVRKEISTIRMEESKLKELFAELATSFRSSVLIDDDASRCPPLYVYVASKCVALFSIGQVTWPEAVQFCKSISGTLGVLSEMKDYKALQDYLKCNEFSSNYWIGGHLEKDARNWNWIDGNEMEMGAPYWSIYKTQPCTKRNNSDVCYDYSVMPLGIPNGCLAMDYQYFYYFSDANCFEKRSPLCFYK